MTRKRIQFIGSLLITFFFLYLAFRNVTWTDLWNDLREVNYLWVIPFMLITLVSFYFRTLRWKYLLEPVIDAPARTFLSPLFICFALNSILPGRVGEFARAYLVSRDHKVPFSSTFATVIVERMYDGLGLLVLFAAILVFVPLGQDYSEVWDARKVVAGSTLRLWGSVIFSLPALLALIAAVVLTRRTGPSLQDGGPAENADLSQKRAARRRAMSRVLFVAGAISLVAAGVVASGLLIDSEKTYTFGKEVLIDGEMLRALSMKLLSVCVVILLGTLAMLWRPFRRFVQGCISWTPLVPRGVKDALNRFIDKFTEGFHSLRSPRLIFWVIFHTATVWLAVGGSLVVLAWGFPGVTMNLTEGMAVAIIICIAILIPAAPGYWGLYEVGCLLGLLMLGCVSGPQARAQALSYALVGHFFQIIPAVLPGLFFMWHRQVGLTELTAVEGFEDVDETATP